MWGICALGFCKVLCRSTVHLSCGSLTSISHYSGYWKSSNGKFNRAKDLVPNVWMSVLSLQSTTSSKKPGDILIYTDMCYNHIYDWLDNTFQKRTQHLTGCVCQ